MKSNMYSMASSRAEPQCMLKMVWKRASTNFRSMPLMARSHIGKFSRTVLLPQLPLSCSRWSWFLNKNTATFYTKSALPMFSSGSSMVSGLFMFLTHFIFVCDIECMSESRSVMSNSLRSHRLYSPWNSPSQNTGVGRISLL